MELAENSPLRRGILTIKNSGEKAAAIVQDLLTLARRGVPVMEPVGLNRIITDYLRSPEFQKLRSFHPASTIESDLAGDLLPIQGSPVHLSKVVMNLVFQCSRGHALRRHHPDRDPNQYVDTTIRGYDQVAEGEYIVLKVSDWASGLRRRTSKRSLSPFTRRRSWDEAAPASAWPLSGEP